MSPTKKSKDKKTKRTVRQTEFSDVAGESRALALRGLVDVSLNRSDGSIDNMLKFITDWFDGFGCILWQTTPSTNVNSKPLRGELFVLAEFFPEDVRCAMHDLPIEGSWTGGVVSQNQANNIPKIADGSGRLQNKHFIESSRLQSMISAPVRFDENTRGALNVYRQDDQPPFSAEDLKTLEDMASAVSHLYEANRERSGFQLLSQVNEIVREAEARPAMSLKDKRGYLRRICEVVGETFDALETSIYLAYPRENTKEYGLQATTWEESVEVETYKPALNGSVTAWILAHGTPVKILNLPDFCDDSPRRNGEYPGLVWKRSEHFLQLVKELVGGDPLQQPPISFIGTPIISGEETLGVIRCCAAKRSPFFFSAADLKLLKLVAAQISQCWSSWMARCDLVDEVAQWQRVVDETNELNRIVQSQLGDQSELMTSSLMAFSKGVDGADALAIRLWDKVTDELYYENTHGAFWRQGTAKQQEQRLAFRYPIGNGTKSVGAHVFLTKNVYEARDLQSHEYFHHAKAYFSDVKAEVCAPIYMSGTVVGVLDILFIKGASVPRHAKAFAELMGKQLGLYLGLSGSMNRLRQADRESKQSVKTLKAVQAQQQRTFEDLSHQLKGPLRVASGRADQVLKKVTLQPELNILHADMLAMRGMLRKSQRVAGSVGLLAELESGRPLKVRPSRLGESDLVRLLIEMAADASNLARSQRVHFHVDRERFHALRQRNVNVDRDLLEQAVYCLYDNAAKYSFENSHVDISGGTTRGGSFYISITNEGLKLRGHEIKNCKDREWRSAETMKVSGEGSGIGLWIVDHIMKAHGGELIIDPTTSENLTVVRLVFPFAS